MNKKYYIGLQLAGLDNNTIIKLMSNLQDDDFKKIFEGNLLEIEFKYNFHIDKNKYRLHDKNYLENILNDSEKVLNDSKKLGVKVIPYLSSYYPKALRNIENPPAILYLKGKNIVKSDEKSIACVGTRNPSEFGINAIKSIVTNLSNEKFTIISGLADGVDKLAHETCLTSGGRTIAVLAHGLDTIYPKCNETLADNILKNNGTLISEYPVGTKIEKFRFVHRNRIVSGLSKGILMIEAKEKSGTRHTVDFAISQNKMIFCPDFIRYSDSTSLNFKLINEKLAFPIKNYDDYINIVKKLGYKLKYDKNMIKNIKNKNMKDLIETCKKQNIRLNDLILESSKTGFTVDKKLYFEFKKILSDNDLTIKEFFNALILGIVNGNKGE
ncbi:DNA-protecting protein DprA [Clostridium perfringens]|uniref:DNA-processing protein DprA n=1 Tax=Clostridium perfringens TaxID=1502 RepID=UPI000EB4B2C2|nr:DNA-processing protein DprA [Clostridium perfringens]MBO3303680.1 DNA-protecting protein DprA [Clostridium perfringens]MBO3306842.1 DNA-protecting protein DprA [Clostridium perfringens]MBO3310086.1 DNA-protecting protein DprA [Clostridium perfringens]MBO3316539.1 DNA-protecting protein DprA [Clostridium perfringens]MBO3391445.1 DNA-protecting protein DprA [Clostridium perfringens]